MMLLYVILSSRRVGHVLLLSHILIGLHRHRNRRAPAHLTWYLTIVINVRTRTERIFPFALKLEREKILSYCVTFCCVVRSLTLIVLFPRECSSFDQCPTKFKVPIFRCVVQRGIPLLVYEVDSDSYSVVKRDVKSDDTGITSIHAFNLLTTKRIPVLHHINNEGEKTSQISKFAHYLDS
jgi:hypothetical protein